ncbi:hypothetical protein TruAng_009902 [Truncatella angustata]|nr:hypothetical protein TruAng_009902 [Truncatella angustata]
MAPKFKGHVKSSLAEGSTSAVEKTTKPILRTAFQTANNHSDPVNSPSLPPSESRNQPVKPTINKVKARPLNFTDSMESMFNLTIAKQQYDYFGSLVYTSGEALHVYLWPVLFALFFLLIGVSYLVLACTTFYALTQYIKITLTMKDLPKLRLMNALQSIDHFVCKTMYFAQGFLTVILVLIQPILWYFGLPTLWTYAIYALVFLEQQALYWSLHGYILHKQITVNRPEIRDQIVDSIDGAWREIVTYRPRFLLLFTGSGGHTAELIRFMKLFEPFDSSSLRRWVVTMGDQRSIDEIKKYEQERSFKRRGNVAGAFEIAEVARARYVMQSWLTTPFTALSCVLDCVRVLNLPRPWTPHSEESGIEYPQTILCNGPGSAAIFVFVSHMMRMYGIIPANRCQVLFIESIARVKTLSLTGKIFYYLDLADAFIVQHKPVAEKYPGVIAEDSLTSRAHTGGDSALDWGPDVINDIRDD